MALYLIDTNHLSDALNNTSSVRERLFQSRRQGHRFGTCVPVLCELETGLYHTLHRDRNRRILAELLQRQIRRWPLEQSCRLSMPMSSISFARGRALSQVDMMLAARLARWTNITHIGSGLRGSATLAGRELANRLGLKRNRRSSLGGSRRAATASIHSRGTSTITLIRDDPCGKGRPRYAAAARVRRRSTRPL